MQVARGYRRAASYGAQRQRLADEFRQCAYFKASPILYFLSTLSPFRSHRSGAAKV